MVLDQLRPQSLDIEIIYDYKYTKPAFFKFIANVSLYERTCEARWDLIYAIA